MVYEIKSNITLLEIDRTEIVDISVGDILQAKAFPKFQYTWKEQDSQFLESNPDAQIFLKIQQSAEHTYKGVGLMIVPSEAKMKN